MAAAFAVGLVLADLSRPGYPVAAATGIAGVVCLVFAWALHRRWPDPAPGDLLPRVGAATACLLLAGAGAVGFSDLAVRSAVLAGSALPALDGRVVAVEGRLASDPAPAGRSWAYTIRSVGLFPELPEPGIHREAPALPLTGRLLVRSYGTPPKLVLGDLVRMEIKVAALDLDQPYDARLYRRGIVAGAVAVSPVEVLAPTSNPLLAGSNFFRDRMQRTAQATIKRDQAALLLGLVIGDERRISERVRDDFRASGLAHLTAVSGANVAMVVGALAIVLNVMRAPRRLSIVAGLAAIVVFTVITRWEPSVLRAAVMASVGLAAFLFGRLSSTSHGFVLAFLGILAFDPMVLWHVGFQLSFAATAGILWLRPPLVARLRALPRPVAEAVAIGIAAQAAVFPLIALHFGRISVAAVPANLTAFALVAPITILGFAGGVLAMGAPALAWPFLKVAGLLVSTLQWVAKIFGRSEVAEIGVPGFRLSEAAAAYLGIAAVWLLLVRRGRWARWPAVTGAVLLLGATLAPALGTTLPAGLRVTFFDVGEGDAALVESPAGARILIDGGRDPDLIAARLKRRGFERVDMVVASHMHADHVVGLQAVLRRMEIGMAVHPGVRAPLLPTLTAERPMEVAGAGDSVRLGDVTVDFLGPSPDMRDLAAISVTDQGGPEGPGLNDASVVLRVNWAGECVLFTGDIEDAAQAELIDVHEDRIDCTVMKAPHHGSGRLIPEFVAAVDPEWIAVSVGRNTYGHPSPKAIAIFEEAGAEVLRTDQLGDVVIEIDHLGKVRAPG